MLPILVKSETNNCFEKHKSCFSNAGIDPQVRERGERGEIHGSSVIEEEEEEIGERGRG